MRRRLWVKGKDVAERDDYRTEAAGGIWTGKWLLITAQNLKLWVTVLKLAMTEPGF